MSHEYKCGTVFCRSIQGIITCLCDCLCRDRLCNGFLIIIDYRCVFTNLAEQRFCNCNGYKLIAVLLHCFHQLVILCAMHQMGRLNHKVLYPVCHRAV